MKIPKILIEYLSVGVPMTVVCFILLISGKVSLNTYSFAVDSFGKLYVGKDSKIEVYIDQSLVKSIFPMTTKGYLFTIENDDSILLSDASTVYVMDLNGIVLSQREDQFSTVYSKLNSNKEIFVTTSGMKYIKRNILGRIEITQDFENTSTVVYRMPLLDYVVKVVFWTILVSGFIITPFIHSEWKKMLK